jgi:hypothetical protein
LPILEEVFGDRKLLWNNIIKFNKNVKEWMNNPFLKQDIIEIEK